MAAQESTGLSGADGSAGSSALTAVRGHAGWLCAAELGTCIVGSHALAIACARQGSPGPTARDLDLAWSLDVAAGERLLREQGVFLATTPGNVGRGTLAMKLAGQRVEITTFRGTDAATPLPQRIANDLAARDMTIGAVACELGSGAVHDPFGGVADFAARRIAPVGDAAQRVREHPVRWLRYFRKARELGFELDRAVRRLDLPPSLLHDVPPEAIALELRAALSRCASPGRFFHDLHECRLLATLAPELDLQFDGRPAGPQRHHPEISQALHMVLALEWAAANTLDLDERDRIAVLVAVLCHDLGKGCTKPADLPAHRGHDRAGVQHVERLLDRFPGLADQRAQKLAATVCELHVEIRHFDELRPGTLANLYERWFRPRDFPVDLFALAVAADSAGRLGHAGEGAAVRDTIRADLAWLRQQCASVDADALRERYPDLAEFRQALHAARALALRSRERG